jgi:hypothetical protein
MIVSVLCHVVSRDMVKGRKVLVVMGVSEQPCNACPYEGMEDIIWF